MAQCTFHQPRRSVEGLAQDTNACLREDHVLSGFGSSVQLLSDDPSVVECLVILIPLFLRVAFRRLHEEYGLTEDHIVLREKGLVGRPLRAVARKDL